MSNILVIADQPRTQQLVTSALEGALATVRFAGSIKHAEEIPSDFPDALLIQDRLSGLSGEILARHLRTIFPGEAVSVILLTDEPGPAGNMRFIDSCIDVRRPDADVARAIRETLAGQQHDESMETDATPMPATDALAGTVEDRVGISGDQPPEEKPPIPSPFSDSLDNAVSDQSHLPLPLAETELELADRQRQAAERLLERPPKRRLGWLYLAIPVTLAATFYFFTGGKAAPTKKPAAPPVLVPAPSAPLPGIATLPSLVPVKGLDPGYARKHPGWERYTDSRQEYKIYRKDAAILALQIIDHSGKGLSPALIERALQETTGNTRYTVTGTSPKEGFVVEKGMAANKAKIIIYKRKSDRQVRGMVLHFD